MRYQQPMEGYEDTSPSAANAGAKARSSLFMTITRRRQRRHDPRENSPMEKKEQERICVERFLKAIGKAPAQIEDAEAPDFRVHFDSEAVGIEVTKSLRFGERGPNTPQAQASLAAKGMNQARSLL